MQVVEHKDRFEVSFKWCHRFKFHVEKMKQIKGGRFDPENKIWVFPLTSRNQILQLKYTCSAQFIKAGEQVVITHSAPKIDLTPIAEVKRGLSQPNLFSKEVPSTNGFTLRPYQVEAVKAGVAHMSVKNKPAILILPTGSGKSLIVAKIALQLSGNTVVLQPSKEILEQNWQKLHHFMPYIDAGIFSASFNRKQVKKITFAMIGSVINQKELFESFNNIIIDECHVINAEGGMYKEFITHLEHSHVLGLTATPYRLHSNSFGSELRFITRTQKRIFHTVAYYCQISEIKEQGFLADLKYYAVKGFDSSKVKVNSNGSEFKDDSLKKYYTEIQFDNSIYGVVQRLIKANRKSILVFTKFVEDARMLVNHLGNDTAIVTGETPKSEREEILTNFKSGKIRVVANVGVLTTGFDYPELETIVLARPTKSLGLYYQMVGRGLRPHKNKESCWIVDLCENSKRFGCVEDLKVDKDDKGRWIISNKGVQMTNRIIE